MTNFKKNSIDYIEWMLILASVNCITVSAFIGLLLNCKTINCWLSSIIILNIQIFLIISSFKWNSYKIKEKIDTHYILSYLTTIILSIIMAIFYTYRVVFDIYIVIYMLCISQITIVFDVITYHSVNNMRTIKTD
jgi:hypothetical protein